MAGQKRVIHIITDLSTGGAELMLYKLLVDTDSTQSIPGVISLTSLGEVGDRILALGMPVTALQMGSVSTFLVDVLRLANLLRREKIQSRGMPVLVQTWMYHADLIGGLAARLAGCKGVIWGIRNSNLDAVSTKRSTRWTVKACAALSRWIPDRIVSCSEAARQIHVGLGYRPEKMMVIPNGFNLDQYHPDPSARLGVRKELGIAEDARLVGLVARFDPQKDHENFIRAAAYLKDGFTDLHFLLCGTGINESNQVLINWINERGLSHRFHLLGQRDDIARITAALDVACSSSAYGEAFANVLGEAMACGVPCVATDVGDARLIVGDSGIVVEVGNPLALANGLRKILEMRPEEMQRIKDTARQRVIQNYDIHRISRQYENLYAELIG
jgi:glycosyltransferase involved in cell wall biosynthesis